MKLSKVPIALKMTMEESYRVVAPLTADIVAFVDWVLSLGVAEFRS